MEERRSGDLTVLAVHGELDLASVGGVRERIDALRAEGRPVLLDLDGLSFMDSTGIRLILQAVEDGRGSGWRFTVTRGSDAVRRVLRAARLDDRLPFGSGDEADR